MEDMFERVFSDFFPARWLSRELKPNVEWLPASELLDKKDHYLFRAEVPGVKKEDLSIRLDDNTLRVTGETKQKSEERKDDFYYCERTYGSFGRVIRLPSEVKAEGIEASLSDGVLEVKLPKTRMKQGKETSIKIK
jgi:HSP20 family protein